MVPYTARQGVAPSISADFRRFPPLDGAIHIWADAADTDRMATVKKFWLILISIPLAYAGKVEILRDEYGVPHVFAADAAGAAFGSGYAQAEDRLEELLKNYRRAEGSMAEAFGPEFFRDDWRQRVWRHRLVAEQHYKDLSPRSRAIIGALRASA